MEPNIRLRRTGSMRAASRGARAAQPSRCGRRRLQRWAQAALALAILVILPAGLARAQVSTSGKIAGTVLDPSGKVIPGAVVTATDAAISVTRTVTASPSGVYVFTSLQPGTYSLSATAKGFATAVYRSVVVRVAQTTNVLVKMTVGAASRTVTVSATGQRLQTTQTTLSTTISPKLMENLPLSCGLPVPNGPKAQAAPWGIARAGGSSGRCPGGV